MLQVLRVNSEKIASGSYVFTFIEIVVSESTSCQFPKFQSCRCHRHQGSSFFFKSRCTIFIGSCQREGYIRRRLKLSRNVVESAVQFKILPFITSSSYGSVHRRLALMADLRTSTVNVSR
jgi:hypothetical protein